MTAIVPSGDNDPAAPLCACCGRVADLYDKTQSAWVCDLCDIDDHLRGDS